MRIIYTHTYNKKAERFLKKHPDLVNKYQKTLELLEQNPYHTSLRLHPLKGKMHSFYSVSINLTYRITLDFAIEDQQIILLNVGDHHCVY